MKKNFLHRFSLSQFALSFTLAQLASVSVINAAEDFFGSTGDYHHDTLLQRMFTESGFTQERLRPADKKPVLLFDIQKGYVEKLRQEQLKESRTLKIDIAASTSTTSWGTNIYQSAAAFAYSPVALISYMSGFRSSSKAAVATSPVSTVSTGASSSPTSPVVPLKQNEVSLLPAATSDIGSTSPTSLVAVIPTTVVPDGPASATSSSPASPATPKASAKSPVSDKEPQNVGVGRSSAVVPREIIFSLDGDIGSSYMEAIWIEHFEKLFNRPISTIAKAMGGSSFSGGLIIGLAVHNADGKPCMSGSDEVNIFENSFELLLPPKSMVKVPAKLWRTRERLNYTQYTPPSYETLLHLGQTTLASARTDVLIPTLNVRDNSLFMLSNRSHPKLLAWEAARAASVGPSKYSAFQPKSLEQTVVLVDGSLKVRDPALKTLLFAQANARADGRAFNPLLISMGTRTMPMTQSSGVFDLKSGLEPIMGAMIDAQAIAATSIFESALEGKLVAGTTYFRIDSALAQAVSSDKFSDSKGILRTAAESQFETIDKFYDAVLRPILEAK